MINRRLQTTKNRAKKHLYNFDIDTLLKLSQILAIFIGGLWVVYEYYTWKSYSNRLDIELKAVQAKYADNQQRLLLDQTRLANESQKLTVKQYELANEASKLALKEKGIDLDVKELDRDIALNKCLDFNNKSSVKLINKDGDKNQYKVSIQLSATNLSKSKLLIGKVVTDFFLGIKAIDDTSPSQSLTLTSATSTSNKSFSTRRQSKLIIVEGPPDFMTFGENGGWEADKPESRRGDIIWTRIKRDAFRHTAMAFQGDQYNRIKDYLRFGGPTGEYSYKEAWIFSRDIYVEASPDSLIGLVVTLFFQESPKTLKHHEILPEDYRSYSLYLSLTDTEQN